MVEYAFKNSDMTIIITNTPWYELPVDALVLSANNQLRLKGATGLARYLAEECPEMHEKIQQNLVKLESEPGRGLTFGNGMTIDGGPNDKSVIHAVTVDYHHEATSVRYASVASVAAATEFAIHEARNNDFHSIGFALMCTRGHADEFLPTAMAKIELPLVQLKTIFGMLAVAERQNPRRVYITTYSPQDKESEAAHSNLLENELNRLSGLYDSKNY